MNILDSIMNIKPSIHILILKGQIGDVGIWNSVQIEFGLESGSDWSKLSTCAL